MKKKNERNARKEEARKELKPEVQDGVKLTDEQMEQVSGGAVPRKHDLVFGLLVAHGEVEPNNG